MVREALKALKRKLVKQILFTFLGQTPGNKKKEIKIHHMKETNNKQNRHTFNLIQLEIKVFFERWRIFIA